jgi:hypothetical protein
VDVAVTVPGTPEDVSFSLSDPNSGVPGTDRVYRRLLREMLKSGEK